MSQIRKQEILDKISKLEQEIDYLFESRRLVEITNLKFKITVLEQELALIEDDIIIEKIANSNLTGSSKFHADLIITNNDVKLNWYASGSSKLHALSTAKLHANEFFNNTVINIWMTIEDNLIILHGFYSLAMIRSNILQLIHPDDALMMKGLAYSSLCYILTVLPHYNIDLPNDIELSAEGEIPGKSMEGLIKYYNFIGFESTNEYNDLGELRMFAEVDDILDRCPKNIKHRFDDLQTMITVALSPKH